MIVACYCVAIGIAIWSSVSDINSRCIPNVAVIFLVAVAIVLSCLTGIWIDWLSFAIAVIIGLGVYLLRCFGAGDVKYFWACMLVVPDQIETLLIGTALAGLVLAIVYLARHRFRPKEVGSLPYGVAISIGLLLCLSDAMI